MKVFIVLVLILFSLTFSQVNISAEGERTEREGYGKYYFPFKIEVIPPSQVNTTLFEGRINLGSSLGACGDVARWFGLEYLTSSFDDIWNNLKSMALPATLYFVASYTPVLAEVFTATQWLQNITAQLAGMSCEQVFSAIRRMNADRSKLVQWCVNRRLEQGHDIKSAYESCLQNGINVGDLISFIDRDLGEKLSVKGLYRCMLAKGMERDPKDCTVPGSNCSFKERVAALSYLILPDIKLSADGSVKLDTGDYDIAFQVEKWKRIVKRDIKRDYERLRRDIDSCTENSESLSSYERCVRNVVESFLQKYNVEWRDFPALLTFIRDLKKEVEKRLNSDDEYTKMWARRRLIELEDIEEEVLEIFADKVSLMALRKARDMLQTAYYQLKAYERLGGKPTCSF